MNLVQTTPTAIDYGYTPSSDRSVYFDAPAMNSESKFTEDLPPVNRSSHDLPGAFGDDADAPQDNQGGADIKRKPSIAMPRDPVIKKAPADGDEEEEPEYDEPDQHNGSHRRASSAGVTTDSGYASGGTGGPGKRSHSRASASEGSFAPIPILWTDSPNARDRSLADDDRERPSRESPFRRASSLRSFRTGTAVDRERDDRAGHVGIAAVRREDRPAQRQRADAAGERRDPAERALPGEAERGEVGELLALERRADPPGVEVLDAQEADDAAGLVGADDGVEALRRRTGHRPRERLGDPRGQPHPQRHRRGVDLRRPRVGQPQGQRQRHDGLIEVFKKEKKKINGLEH